MNNDARKGTFAAVGAVIAAIISSACCWLPLVLLVFGFSGGVVAAKFEAWRPIMLPVTFILLALGWYFTLRPARSVLGGGQSACATGPDGEQSCCPPASQGRFSIRKFNLGMLAVATVMTLAFSFFPNYVGALFANDDPVTAAAGSHQVVLGIEGMTCAGCEVAVTKHLETVAGVEVSDVDYVSGQAMAQVPADLDEELLRQAVEKAGYRVTDIQSE